MKNKKQKNKKHVKSLTLIPPERRPYLRCHICDTIGMSVKYTMKVFDPVVNAYTATEVSVCNRCALRYAGNNQ